MKELKDYIHLYIGCECIIGDLNWKPETNLNGLAPGVDPEYGKPIRTKLSHHICEHFVHQTTLILRPLSDMSEEERMDFYEKYFGKRMANDYTGDTGSAYFQPKKIIPTTDHIMRIVCGDDYSSGDFMKVVEMVPWLLSKGFDLFGLQAAGIAVYETEIKK